MRILATFLPATIALLGAASLHAQPASFQKIPSASSAMDITPDGQVIVGGGSGGGYYWRWQVEPAPTFIGGRDAVAVSDDGSVLVGCITDPGGTGAEVAARWTQATGWVSLGYLPNALNCPSRSNAYDVSGDGNTVIGLSWDGCSGRGFIWTQATGMQELQVLGNGGNRASAIAGNGSVVGGFAQGSNRTPAIWFPNQSGMLYNINDFGEVFGFSEDGTIALGSYNGEAYYEVGPGVGARVTLPELVPGWSGIAMRITADQSTIVGFDIQGGARQAWIWDQAGGIRSLRSELTQYGVEAPTLEVCTAISGDGRIVIGHNAFRGAFVATLPKANAAALSCGVNPPNSLTILSGLPLVGTTMTFGVDNPLGTQSVGSSPLLLLGAAPLPCGTLLPGWGMAPGGPGALLVSPVPLLLAVPGPAWAGAGNPAPISLTFPNNTQLINAGLATQGVMVDLVGPNVFGLAGGYALTIGQ